MAGRDRLQETLPIKAPIIGQREPSTPMLRRQMAKPCSHTIPEYLGAATIFAIAHQGRDQRIRAKRHKPPELFYDGRRLEALRLLESLIRKLNPIWDEMVLAFGGLAWSSMRPAVGRSGTAGKDVFAARRLLDKAWKAR